MALSFIASASGYSAGDASTIDTSSSLNVAAGDLIVGMLGCWNNPTAVTMADNDGSTNSMTMLSLRSAGSLNSIMGYRLVATADSSATFRATLTTARNYMSFVVLQFRPDSGEAFTLDASGAYANGTSQYPQTNNLTTTGADEIAVAWLYLNGGKTWSGNRLIGESAADGQVDPAITFHVWYEPFTSTQTDIHAQADMGGSDSWLIDFAAFKSAASGTSVSVSPGLLVPNAVQHDPMIVVPVNDPITWTPHVSRVMVF